MILSFVLNQVCAHMSTYIYILTAMRLCSECPRSQPPCLNVCSGDDKVTGALGQPVQRGLWLWTPDEDPGGAYGWRITTDDDWKHSPTNQWTGSITTITAITFEPNTSWRKCSCWMSDTSRDQSTNLNGILNEIWIICPSYCPELTKREAAVLFTITTLCTIVRKQ